MFKIVIESIILFFEFLIFKKFKLKLIVKDFFNKINIVN